ncbi:MAG: hypothetical protein AB7K86_04810 [Rhodospirillales bacterium]
MMRFAGCVAASVLAWSGAQAAVVYDESISGDFSNTGASPTAVTVGEGSNKIIGTTGADTVPNTKDYFTFTVPVGLALAHLVVLPGTNAAPGAPGGQLTFLGIQAGDTVTADGAGGSAAGLLGYVLFNAGNIGIDLLPAIGAAGLGATGFLPPLGPGDYSFWIQDTSGGTANYVLDLQLVTEPAPWMLLLGGVAGAGLLRRWSRAAA